MPALNPRALRLLKPAAIVLVLLGLAVAVGRGVSKSLHKPPAPPRTVVTRIGDIVIQVGETGTIQPVDQVDVKSKAAGRLLSIPIREGQFVTRGQLIAVVDRSQIDPQLARDQAQLRQAQARLTQTQAEYALQVRQTRAAIAQARAGLETARAHKAAVAALARPQEVSQGREAVDRAQISYQDALRTQKRRRSLLARGFISQADSDTSQVAVDTAASTLATARQALALTQAGPRAQDVADAQAQVDAARVQLQSAQANAGQDAVKYSDIAQARGAVAQISGDIQQLQVNVTDTRIVAPSAGLVLKKYKEPNEIVQSATTGFSDAQSIVATLGSRLEVVVGINEVDIAKVHPSARATITVDALPGVVFYGAVTEIAPASTNAFASASGASSGGGGANSISKFSVKVAFDRYDPRLRSGMSADVRILSRKHARVVLAPLEAVPFTGAHGQLTVLTAPGHQEKRTVATGLRDDADVEIVSGLKPGEKIVVPPLNGAGRRKSDINGS
jgi:HlyD family secretion protein